MKPQNLSRPVRDEEKWVGKIEKKSARRMKKKKPAMKVSGGSVKKLVKIIKAKI